MLHRVWKTPLNVLRCNFLVLVAETTEFLPIGLDPGTEAAFWSNRSTKHVTSKQHVCVPGRERLSIGFYDGSGTSDLYGLHVAGHGGGARAGLEVRLGVVFSGWSVGVGEVIHGVHLRGQRQKWRDAVMSEK